MAVRLPTQEKNYLTRAGDRIDQLCWQYYGIMDIAVEAVYARNRFLSKFPPVLPPMLLIVLPIINNANFNQANQLWSYQVSTLYQPSNTVGDGSGRSSVSGNNPNATTVVTPANYEGCCANNVPEVDDADWLAVYIRNDAGDFVLRKMPKTSLKILVNEPDGTVAYGIVEGNDPTLNL